MSPLREKRACEPCTNHWIALAGVVAGSSGPSRVALLTRELPDTVTVDGPPKTMLPVRPPRAVPERRRPGAGVAEVVAARLELQDCGPGAATLHDEVAVQRVGLEVVADLAVVHED